MANHIQITFDAANAPAQAEFWAVALGHIEQPPPEGFDSWEAFADAQNIPADQRDGFGAVVDPDGVGPRILFIKVPEAKTAKNRMHLDIAVADPEAHIKALVAAGATRGDDCQEFGASWTVMADPEGNEFCVTQAEGH